jgi:hypothetical protein
MGLLIVDELAGADMGFLERLDLAVLRMSFASTVSMLTSLSGVAATETAPIV